MRKLLPVLAALLASPAFAQVDITSPSGDWTATLASVLGDNSLGVPPSGHNGQIANLIRNGNDNLWETIFYEATSTNGNRTRRIEETYTQTMETIGANSATFRLVRNDSLLQLDVDVVMIDGEDGGVLVDIQWTNIGPGPIDVKPFVYADLDVDGAFGSNTGRWLFGTAGVEQTQEATGVSRWFGETDAPYSGWGIAAGWPGMRNDLDAGVTGLDNCCSEGPPDDYTAALSLGRRTLQPGETHEFSFRLGGVGGACEPCDMNCDEEVNAFDIEPFLTLLFDPNADPCCGERGSPNPFTGDVNGDGEINAFDIEPFLECLFP